LKAIGKWPSAKDRLAICTIIGANTALELVRNWAGKTSRGDVFGGLDDSSFCISPTKTG
jgi:hypothetical protein